jgi:hypothetical protein
MKASAFVAFSFVFVLVTTSEGLTEQTSVSKPEVIRGAANTIVLPRQAGSRDAPDVSLARSAVFELQSDRSETWIVEQGATSRTNPTRRAR